MITIPQISTNQIITSQLIEHIKKRPGNMTLEIQVLAWDRHKNVAVLNLLMRFNQITYNN